MILFLCLRPFSAPKLRGGLLVMARRSDGIDEFRFPWEPLKVSEVHLHTRLCRDVEAGRVQVLRPNVDRASEKSTYTHPPTQFQG